MSSSAQDIRLVSSDDLATALGFAAPNDAFRNFCRSLDIIPLRRNPNFFDPKLVRIRLDQAQGLHGLDKAQSDAVDLVAQRRARRAAQ